MFKSLLVTIVFLLASGFTYAATDFKKISSVMYPDSQEDQEFVQKFFEISEAHKTLDPLLEGKGPSIKEFSIDKIRYAFIVNVSDETADLVFFNWDLSVFDGLNLNTELSDLYGSSVYTLKRLNKKSIASQGEDRSQLTNFSYMIGANTFKKQILKNSPPNLVVSDQMLDWKPNPDYLDRNSPLRAALDLNSLAMLSPSKKLFFEGFGIPAEYQSLMEPRFAKSGGFQNMIMGMMVHEMFHVKEGQDKVNDLVIDRSINEDRKEIISQINSSADLRQLLATYVKIVFSIASTMKSKPSDTESQLLSELRLIIDVIKTKYPETWKFVWNYEYTEGFAEYASAYSMVQVGITTLDQKIDLEIADPANNFAYRSGALGGLFLSQRLMVMPFQKDEDHKESLWEIVLRLKSVKESDKSVEEITQKYGLSDVIDQEDEIKRVIEYLVSTVNE
ncbi:MAG: hypothetical protein V4654_01865 [Bdellovibrionota bacterium]